MQVMVTIRGAAAYVCNLAAAADTLSRGSYKTATAKLTVAVTDTAMGPENQNGCAKWEPERHNPRYEVVFFDLYGTLIDIRTDERCETAWQALYDCSLRGLGADYESVDEMRERFEKLEAREMVHQADRAIVRNGWDEFDILPVYRSLLMNRSEEG